MMNQRKYLLYISLAFIYIISLSGAAAAQEKAVEGLLVPVLTATVQRGEIRDTLKFNGTVYSMNSVKVSSKIPGQAIEIFYDEGDEVKEGDVLLKIDDREISLRLKQAKEGVIAADEIYKKATGALKLEEEQLDLQIQLSSSNLEAAGALYEKAKKGARPEEKKQAEANMAAAESAMKNAELNHKRMKELFEKKAVSEQQYDLARMQYDVSAAQFNIARENVNLIQAGLREEDIKAAEANYNSAQTAVKIAESLKLKLELLRNDITAAVSNMKRAEYEEKIARIMLGDTSVVSPTGGIISQKFIEEGEVIQAPGIPLFTVLKQEQMKITVNVPEIDIMKIKTGFMVHVTLDSYPDMSFTGTVDKLSPVVDKKLRTLEVEIAVPNGDGLLKEGMFARAAIYTAVHENALYVPSSAVFARNGDRYVFLLRGDTPEKKDVQTGIAQEGYTEIVSGLSEGDRVISQGNFLFEEGMKVQIESE